MRALGEIDDVAAAPAIASALKDEDAGVRQGALEVLFSIGCDLPAARECLLEIVQDRERGLRIRGKAARALVMSGPQGQYSLLDIWMDQDGLLRQYAIRVSRTAGPPALPFFMQVIPTLVKLLRSQEPAVELTRDQGVGYYAKALGKIGPPALPVLSEMLGDADPRIRGWAALGLQAMGADAKPAIPGLTNAVDDEDPEVVAFAAAALGAVGARTDRVVPQLIRTLRHEHWHSRHGAAVGLGRVGPGRGVAARPRFRHGKRRG